jgi:RNA polymerase sigma factor (sigma-70 family)
MPTRPISEVVQHFRRTILEHDGTGLTDGQLLACFLEERDEAAFAGLMRRHGPMVWGVCRRMLSNHHDAEDAFQAAFLVLVRKAASIAPREKVANWLYGVAYQTALKARATAARRRARERQVMAMPEPEVTAPDCPDLLPLLDQELSRLPDKYRVPIVLCDLQGKTHKEAARQLGWPDGTLSGRLSRARTLLARRLAQRGLALSSAALTALLMANSVSAGVPLAVARATMRAAGLLLDGEPALCSAASAKVAALVEGVMKTMLLTKLKTLTTSCLAVVFVLMIGGAVGHRVLAGDKSAAEPQAGGLRDTLLVLDQQFWEAASKHDIETLDRLFAADYRGLGNDGHRWTKAAILEQHKLFRLGERKITTEREVVRIDERTALLTYEAKFKVFTKSGQLSDTAHQRLLACWVQRDGGWFIAFSQATDVVKPAPQAKAAANPFDLFNQPYAQTWLTQSFNGLSHPWQLSSSFGQPLVSSSTLQAFPYATTLHPFTQSPFARSSLGQPVRYFSGLTPLNASVFLSTTEPNQLEPKLRQLIDKALQAHGGEAELRRLKTFTLKVEQADDAGRISTIQHFVQLPDSYRVEITHSGENVKEIHILGKYGMQHWRKGPDGKVEALHLFGLEPTREYWLDFLSYFGPRALLRLKDPAYQFKGLDEIDVNFRPVMGVQLTPVLTASSGKPFIGPERNLYFDKENGLLVKEQQGPREVLYGAHQAVQKITWAYKWAEKANKGQEPIRSTIREIKIVDKLDAELFQKP